MLKVSWKKFIRIIVKKKTILKKRGQKEKTKEESREEQGEDKEQEDPEAKVNYTAVIEGAVDYKMFVKNRYMKKYIYNFKI